MREIRYSYFNRDTLLTGTDTIVAPSVKKARERIENFLPERAILNIPDTQRLIRITFVSGRVYIILTNTLSEPGEIWNVGGDDQIKEDVVALCEVIPDDHPDPYNLRGDRTPYSISRKQ